MNLVMSIVVVPNGYSDKVIHAANQVGATGATIVRARGMDNTQKKGLFNFNIEPEEEIILITATTEITSAVCDRIREGFARNKCNGSIYILPVK